MPQIIGLNTPPTNYKHISGAGTVVVKSTPAVIAAVVINGGTLGATATLFDQSTTVTTTNTIAAISLGTAVGVVDVNAYNIETNAGLVVVSSAGIDLTICYR